MSKYTVASQESENAITANVSALLIDVPKPDERRESVPYQIDVLRVFFKEGFYFFKIRNSSSASYFRAFKGRGG